MNASVLLAPVVGDPVLRERLGRLRGDTDQSPHASIVIPVNAQGDLKNVRRILSDVGWYRGRYRFEVILVVNNFEPDRPPPEIGELETLGIRVLRIPNVRRPGEAVGFSARIPGIRAAATDIAILFDADCRVVNATALLDWYVQQFRAGAKAAYTHVGYFELRNKLSVKARIAIHHAARAVKRNVLRMPTTRGSNYAVHAPTMLRLYDEWMLADEMNVGPTFKREGPVHYCGGRELVVLTSGRMFHGGWRRLMRYLVYRLRYNLRVLPVRPNAAHYTGREKDPVRRYVDNQPVTE